MKRMLARKAQTFRQRFFLRRRIKTLACSPLSIWMIPASCKLGHEPGKVFDRDRLGAVLPLERFLHLLQRLLAVELLEEEVLFDLEAEVLEGKRVLDHVVRHPLVELGLDDQVGTQLDHQMFGGLPEGESRGQVWERHSWIENPMQPEQMKEFAADGTPTCACYDS